VLLSSPVNPSSCSIPICQNVIFLITFLKGNGATEKRLRFSELRDLFTKLDYNSILMVYQYHERYRTENQDFPEAVADKIEQEIGRRLIYIDDKFNYVSVPDKE
jgi:hypothetical protein